MSKHYPFTLEPLPYAYDALSPVLDARTLEFHHDKHLQTYVDNLNAALKDAPSYHTWELERLILQLDSLPENLRTPVRNNAGGVYNHELYFASMTGGESRPGPAMLRELEKAFGSYEAWKEQMKQAALTQFGSGWAWLIADAEDGLHIVKTPNPCGPGCGRCCWWTCGSTPTICNTKTGGRSIWTGGSASSIGRPWKAG